MIMSDVDPVGSSERRSMSHGMPPSNPSLSEPAAVEPAPAAQLHIHHMSRIESEPPMQEDGSDQDNKKISLSNEDEDPIVREDEGVLSRDLTPDQLRQDLERVYGSWEFSTILEFLFRFRSQLQLKTEIGSADALAQALVCSPGPGLLSELHIELLAGILSSKKALDSATWTANLSNRLKHEWSGLRGRPTPPFRATRGYEAREYAALDVGQRIQALKALCDIRLSKDDMRVLSEQAAVAKPPAPAPPPPPSSSSHQQKQNVGSGYERRSGGPPTRGSIAAATAPPPPPHPPLQRRGAKDDEADEFGPPNVRKQPLGVDGSGLVYWLFDCWVLGSIGKQEERGVNYGIFLYREHPSTTPKPSAPVNHDLQASTSDGAEGKEGGDGGKRGKGRKPAKPKKRSAAEEERERLLSYEAPPLSVPGKWERVAGSLEELEELGSKLKRSLKKPDQDLSSKILDSLIPSIQERIEAEERMRKSREKTRKHLGAEAEQLMLGTRSTRVRKPVRYNDSHGARDDQSSDSEDERRKRRRGVPTTNTAEARKGMSEAQVKEAQRIEREARNALRAEQRAEQRIQNRIGSFGESLGGLGEISGGEEIEEAPATTTTGQHNLSKGDPAQAALEEERRFLAAEAAKELEEMGSSAKVLALPGLHDQGHYF